MKRETSGLRKWGKAVLEAMFCIYLARVMFIGFLSSPETVIYLVCSFVVAVVVPGSIYVELRYISWLEIENKELMRRCYELEILNRSLEENKENPERTEENQVEKKVMK